MPIYEYKCSKCKNRFQAMQKFSDAPLLQCPTCGGDVKKLISRSSFHLKGSGWYLTDYAKKNSSSSEPESVSSSSSNDTSSSDD
ncbi:MAG TPA: zinc ribbon domain-containing protein [Deltaproteobacteria bacterium]|jgi:putative FmdB family regulatory protein|nr:zinc ribbon domain-containing protein [Deltaproteobacteria bacterium]HOI06463.1 zinc ribbon domain-containing protein [Deltaproteobacteria bacterium]